jgi:hypothetical protein
MHAAEDLGRAHALGRAGEALVHQPHDPAARRTRHAHDGHLRRGEGAFSVRAWREAESERATRIKVVWAHLRAAVHERLERRAVHLWGVM